ncbi:MAG TPA: Ig-like domain-containing protein [Streptosporangiaceae bacterium]|nr:Ig-like domain-containing protein [Streptosporangiaceae bacterium]
MVDAAARVTWSEGSAVGLQDDASDQDAAEGDSGTSGTATGGGRRPPMKIAVAAGAVVVIAIALVVVAVSGPSHKAAAASLSTVANHKKKAGPVSLISVTPGNGSDGVNGADPIIVTYSGPVTPSTPLPTLTPKITGTWHTSGDKATFTPRVGYTEDTHVKVTIPAPAGVTTTAAVTSTTFTTGHYSALRLDQLLSQLGYIPLSWTPTSPSGQIPADDPSAQLAAAYQPPAGTFTFNSGYPKALTSMWSTGTSSEIIIGAIRTFEYDQNLTMDGDAGHQVWAHLLTAITKGQKNQHGYTYVWVTQAGTEHLDLYHNGHLAITSVVNTGIAAANTQDGTYPVYLRYTVTQMQGLNPDGTPYNDTVYWVSYFNGGDAVHAFPRGGYGWYQSLGCVELPYNGSGPGVAENVWNLITYGTLVTVTGPVALSIRCLQG